MIKKCSYCNTEFTARGNKKYCSKQCAKEGKKEHSRAWKRIKYQEQKKRERERKRKRIEAEIIAERSKGEKKPKTIERTETEQPPTNRETTAKPHLIPTNKSYWNKFQETTQSYYKSSGGRCLYVVNGIDIFTDNFTESVLNTIAEDGVIKIWLVSGNSSQEPI